MGCFLGCFGLTTKKQKRIKNCNKFQVHQKYVQLDSEKENAADSEPRDKPKETSNVKVKKKVSFNLNVKAYERIEYDDDKTYFSEEEEKKRQWEYNEQETAKASSMSMYPSSYRYYNCNDEEDEITLEDSDIDDLDDEDYGFSDADDDDDNDDGGDEIQNELDRDTRLNKHEPNEEGGDQKNLYGNSVLLPVENLTQWKAVKARGAQQVKQQKENIIKQEIPLINKPVVEVNPKNNSKPKPQGHEIPVDTSLSNWLVTARAGNGSAVCCYIEDRAKGHQVVLKEVNIM